MTYSPVVIYTLNPLTISFTCPKNSQSLDHKKLTKLKSAIEELINKSSKIQNKQETIETINNLSINGPTLLNWALGTSSPLTELSNKHKGLIATKALKLIFKYIWIPRSATANTSPYTGICWKKSSNFSQQKSNIKIYPHFNLLLFCLSKTNPINTLEPSMNTYITKTIELNNPLPIITNFVYG